MAGPARPSLDVEGTLDGAEWLELHRETLRGTAFWPVLAAVTAGALAAAAVAALLGAPAGLLATGAGAALGMIATYAAGYLWLGPSLRFRRTAPADRTARWRISAERLHTDATGDDVELTWQDVDRVRVTRRLLTFELTGGRGRLALPRRTATELGESLVLGWARDGRTEVRPR